MSQTIQDIVDDIQKKYGLDHYVLHNHHIYAETNVSNKTDYILSLEFLPSEQEIKEGEYNPSGTAIIDMNLHTKDLKQITFLNNVSNATEGIFPQQDMDQIIDWIEEETGMMFGKQFKLVHEYENEVSFQATIDNMEVAPTGAIDLIFNEQGQLTQFSIDGIFPTEEEVDWEPFSLTTEDIIDTIMDHLTLVETPDEENQTWLNLWQVKTFYIKNDRTKLILPENLYQLDKFHQLHITVEWDKPHLETFTTEDYDFSTEVSYEEALENRGEPAPITEIELQNCLEEVTKVVSNLFPDESGKWTVTGMYPEKNYIICELIGEKYRSIQRKLKLIIQRDNFTTVNYWDNKFILDMFRPFKEPEQAKIAKVEAFEKLQSSIELTPVYVKESHSDTYQLCGRIVCDDVVDAVSGELIKIFEL
ncbi:hypothetical protein [Ornithinibacillus scapharcae]|uniref:hypothetical protein n=1 Tax=Ornithinibacillus scapharcae TaxID=1147159 RepID=UPI000225B3B6|nr:hypothetical protein [Ornithinibacillus scapharcae]